MKKKIDYSKVVLNFHIRVCKENKGTSKRGKVDQMKIHICIKKIEIFTISFFFLLRVISELGESLSESFFKINFLCDVFLYYIICVVYSNTMVLYSGKNKMD